MSDKNNKVNFLGDILNVKKLSFIITVPFIYSLIFPIVLLHIFIEVYQRVSFPIYGIDIIKFKDFFNTERVKICHLSWIEKIHCLYCDYANGCLAYSVEVAARTEKFWCPIKHKKRRRNAHNHYDNFFEYSDENGFRENKKS